VGGHLHESAYFISPKGPIGQEATGGLRFASAGNRAQIPRCCCQQLCRCRGNRGTVCEISAVSVRGQRIEWEIQPCPWEPG
jgi:hypothetical protein